jgi:hypothetical protein
MPLQASDLHITQLRRTCRSASKYALLYADDSSNGYQTILNAKEQQQGYKGLYLSVVGTIFFGVPFRGTSDTLSQGEILARAESIHGPEHVYRDNYQLLRRDDEHMQLLLSRYLRAVWDDKLPPRAFCFYERKKTDIGALLGPSFKVGQTALYT